MLTESLIRLNQSFPSGLFLPNRYRLVSGSGDAPTALNAFDRALLAAGAGNLNLVKVTSILPPLAQCERYQPLYPGSIVFAAIGSITSAQPGERIAAAVSAGIPEDPNLPGVLMEASFHCSAADAEERVREMARLALEDRGTAVRGIESIAAECVVNQVGAALAAVLLWRDGN